MALSLKLVPHNDPILHTPAPAVEIGDKEALTQLTAMYETMKARMAIGIAAPQVGIAKRMCVVAVGRDLHFMINPIIEFKAAIRATMAEGCLSYPMDQVPVSRPVSLTVAYTDRAWNRQKLRATGLLARCIAHEVDHLDGITMHDRAAEKAKK